MAQAWGINIPTDPQPQRGVRMAHAHAMSSRFLINRARFEGARLQSCRHPPPKRAWALAPEGNRRAKQRECVRRNQVQCVCGGSRGLQAPESGAQSEAGFSPGALYQDTTSVVPYEGYGLQPVRLCPPTHRSVIPSEAFFNGVEGPAFEIRAHPSHQAARRREARAS
jgi:hypothetical protein